MHMILTTYSPTYPQIKTSTRWYEVIYPNLYIDIQKLYQGYTQVIHRALVRNVSRETSSPAYP